MIFNLQILQANLPALQLIRNSHGSDLVIKTICNKLKIINLVAEYVRTAHAILFFVKIYAITTFYDPDSAYKIIKLGRYILAVKLHISCPPTKANIFINSYFSNGRRSSYFFKKKS